MNLHSSPQSISARHLSVAAESIAASQFALRGLDVLEHAGQTRFAYDLGVANTAGMLKVAVHASIGEYWEPLNEYVNSTQRGREQNSFCHAVDTWTRRHGGHIICLVHFDALDFNRMPLIYLVSAVELAQKMFEIRNARLDSWQLERELGLDTFISVRDLPIEWRLSSERIAQLMDAPADEIVTKPQSVLARAAAALVAA